MQRRLLNNRYELHQALGQGGMATVYRGADTRLGRPVAIKLLHAHYAKDEEFRRRFEHEAQAAAGLSSHPNIVDVYDVGQHGDVPFIVMELIEGSDLKVLIEREGPLPIERTLAIAQQVAEGLEYAHSRGLIHRDIKPQNVMVTSDGPAIITDFGIAKSHLSTAVTQAGMTFGTADYISPEQAQGLAATPQSDIYSLGVVVYEMLTKHLPFTGDSPMAVAVQHIQQPPPPLRQWVPTLPPSLERIVLGALAKDPRQRPASARAFATSLREYRAAREQETTAVPVVQRPAAPQPRAPMPRPDVTTPMRAAPPPRAQPVRARRPVTVAVPPPLARPEPRRGSGLGAFVLGLLLLTGLLGLAYFAFGTNTLASLLAPVAQPTTAPAPVETTAPAPTATVAPTNTPPVMVAVPSLIGRPEPEVVQELERQGLVRGVVPPRNDPASAGTVIEQEPAPGTQVQQGSEVRIVVSLGPARATVPDLTNQPFDTVRVALEGAGLVVERVDQPSTTVPAGSVISQSPGPGEVNQGSTVTVTVSAGDVIQFPNVIGRDRIIAEGVIRTTDGLTLVQVDEQGPDRLPNFESFRPNQVVSATANGRAVSNGDYVPRGSQIVIGTRRP